MHSFRTSIAGLLGVILYFAISMAALRSASSLWAGFVLVAAVGLILFAILNVVLRHGPRRTFWGGYAVFSASYLGVSLLALPLPTTWLLERLEPMMCLPTAERVAIPRNRFDQSFSEWAKAHPDMHNFTIEPIENVNVLVTYTVSTKARFVQIGHGLFSVIFGVAGGLILGWVRSAREQSNTAQ